MKYVFNANEKHIGVVSKRVWLKMLEMGRDLDLDKGGIFDSRSGAVNLWVSPEDKPKDWTFEITKGMLRYPRAYLAGIYGQFRESGDFVDLYLVVTNYVRRDEARRLFSEGKISFEEFKEQKKLSEEGTSEEWKWAEEKVKWLIENAERESIFENVVYCPYCGREFREMRLFNDFVLHLSGHVKVKSVVLTVDGNFIETEKGTLTPHDYIKTAERKKKEIE